MKKLLLIHVSLLLCIQSTIALSDSFDNTYQLQGITFHVSSQNDSSLSILTIVPAGLELDNSLVKLEIDGIVINADIADLNSDGSPEIYVFTQSAGSGSYGDVIAFSANNKKSLSRIYMPPLEYDKVNFSGYMGHDKFEIHGKKLLRSFPVYLDGDTNIKPTGGKRTLQYTLQKGEASWILQLQK